MPLLRADFEIVETYEVRPRPALSCTLTALGGLKDRDVLREDLEGWTRLRAGAFKLRMFPGGHFFLNENRDSGDRRGPPGDPAEALSAPLGAILW